jgi:cytidylate kinase
LQIADVQSAHLHSCNLAGSEWADRTASSLSPVIIAIDGPAGAGKSTVAKGVANALGFRYLDSGAMYRALGLSLAENDGDPGRRAREITIELGDGVKLDGRDVTTEIRTPAASEAASKVATDPAVRAALVDKQRELLHDGRDWVAEGRDIGTVVAPDATLKVYLTASPETRARRRADELGADYEIVLRDQALRDQQDEQREHSPLKAAADAVEVDTSDLTIEQVVEQIADLARGRR